MPEYSKFASLNGSGNGICIACTSPVAVPISSAVVSNAASGSADASVVGVGLRMGASVEETATSSVEESGDGIIVLGTDGTGMTQPASTATDKRSEVNNMV